MNFNRYGSKSYAYVVLSNFEVNFLGKRDDATFCSSLYCVLII